MEQQSTVLIGYKALMMSHQLLYWTRLCSSSIIICVMHCQVVVYILNTKTNLKSLHPEAAGSPLNRLT